jgi:hypothetical protein
MPRRGKLAMRVFDTARSAKWRSRPFADLMASRPRASRVASCGVAGSRCARSAKTDFCSFGEDLLSFTFHQRFTSPVAKNRAKRCF